jgi:hypothetical protein
LPLGIFEWCDKIFYKELVMKKVLMILVLIVLGGAVFASGTMDVSTVSDEDIARIEVIVQALDPEVAIQTALDSFPKERLPLYQYLNTQEMKINRIFNEYGIEFHSYDTFEGLTPKAQVAFARLKSRYSYLDSIDLNGPDALRATLELLKE